MPHIDWSIDRRSYDELTLASIHNIQGSFWSSDTQIAKRVVVTWSEQTEVEKFFLTVKTERGGEKADWLAQQRNCDCGKNDSGLGDTKVDLL